MPLTTQVTPDPISFGAPHAPASSDPLDSSHRSSGDRDKDRSHDRDRKRLTLDPAISEKAWDSLIREVCVSGDNPERTLSLFHECMQKRGISPSLITFPLSVMSSSAQGWMDKAIKVLTYDKIANAISYNASIRGGIDEFSHGYVSRIGGFSKATSSPEWSSITRIASPNVKDPRLWLSELDSSHIALALWLERHGVEILGLKSAEKVDSVQCIQTVQRNVAKESEPNVSRPFKYLKDAITVHIKQACKLLGDNNEGSKGKVLEPMADRKSREIGVAQPDGENIESEPVDAVGNQTATTGGKSLVSLNDCYKITGSAKEKVFESKFYRKRSMGTGDDEFSRKRAKAENMDSVDNQSEKSGEDNNIMGDSKGDVQVSNLSVPRVKHGDEDSSSERKFQLSPRTSSNSEAVTWLRRSGRREPRKVKDGRSSDVGMKKEVGDGDW